MLQYKIYKYFRHKEQIQRRSEDPCKHLKWRALQKPLTIVAKLSILDVCRVLATPQSLNKYQKIFNISVTQKT